ncbi:MAG: ABC transporter ATP-binding protein [Clostridiales bacterium]|nr:ABC transporter ATP-binding protein [Clostridiales bacterium]
MKNELILSVKNLNVKFHLRGQELHAIRNVSLDIYQGESIAIVGESGSGKSVFTRTFMGLLDANGYISDGEILYYGYRFPHSSGNSFSAQDTRDSRNNSAASHPSAAAIDLAKVKKEREWRAIRGGEIAMIMQDPMTSLNPLKTIGSQIAEAIRLHQPGIRGSAAINAKVVEYLREVGILEPERRSKQYAHEFCVGMRQWVVIAIALACNPKILICDEPTTALDVTIQDQIIHLLKELKEKYQLTIVFITHDLGVVANIADRVAVMYAGDFVEIGLAEEIFYDPRHPYTWALLSSLPQLGERGEKLFTIKGTPPSLFKEVKGDAFAPRNPQALKIDYVKAPPYFEVSPTHKAKTWLLDPRAPKVEPPEAIRNLKNVESVYG